MALYDELYTGIKDFLAAVSDRELKVEIAVSRQGDEWTGVKISRLPTSQTVKAYIDGTYDMAFKLSLESKQAVTPDAAGFIADAVYLNDLCRVVTRRICSGEKPAVPPGVRFLAFELLNGPALLFTDAKYSGYTADIQFLYKITQGA